ncbi:hypothetical protein [Duganella sp. HH105]|uniref:hypothetical protein n=1 Tax=Duganella sp. HH105 TaxID=1781067 RepID=UPI000877D3C2|nr:hypothetical protein [Duganella sp. HH105]OEZ51012.1 hypothetical protein DUGA6_62390 [Duganella sp. HH105]
MKQLDLCRRAARPAPPLLMLWLLLAAAPAPAQQVELGRLFATPAERGTMDRQRDTAAAGAAAGAMPQQAAAQEAAPPESYIPAGGTPSYIPNGGTPYIPNGGTPYIPNGGTPTYNGGALEPPAGAAVPAAATPSAAPPSSAVQLSGVLRGSSGRTTVWLNQVPQENIARTVPGKGVALRLSSGRQLILKPGQSFDAANGHIQEVGH